MASAGVAELPCVFLDCVIFSHHTGCFLAALSVSRRHHDQALPDLPRAFCEPPSRQILLTLLHVLCWGFLFLTCQGFPELSVLDLLTLHFTRGFARPWFSLPNE